MKSQMPVVVFSQTDNSSTISTFGRRTKVKNPERVRAQDAAALVTLKVSIAPYLTRKSYAYHMWAMVFRCDGAVVRIRSELAAE